MDALSKMRMSRDSATNLAAGALVATGCGALVYFGGKAAVVTACLVGGGLAAVAVSHTAVKLGLDVIGEVGVQINAAISKTKRSMDERPQPVPQERAAQAS